MEKKVDQNQTVETKAYVPVYRIKPEFKDAILKAVGEYPFNQIAGLIQALNVDTIDHASFSQLINALGNFPYVRIAGILQSVNQYVEQVLPDEQENAVPGNQPEEPTAVPGNQPERPTDVPGNQPERPTAVTSEQPTA